MDGAYSTAGISFKGLPSLQGYFIMLNDTSIKRTSLMVPMVSVIEGIHSIIIILVLIIVLDMK